MVIRDFCNECKGKNCCDRILKLQSLNDEYKHITNIILDINCELYRFGAINCTAYGTMRQEIRFEKGEFTQCKYCLYKSVCKHDPELVTKEANDILNQMKNITDCKIACASFYPEQQDDINTKKYYCYAEDEVEGSFCDLLNLKKINISALYDSKEVNIFIPKDISVDIVPVKDSHNKSGNLAVIKTSTQNKDKKGFFKGRKRSFSHIKYNE